MSRLNFSGEIAMRILLLIIILVPFIGTANAYIDPGSMSIVMQAVVGAVVGSIVAGKVYWGKIKETFQRIFSEKK